MTPKFTGSKTQMLVIPQSFLTSDSIDERTVVPQRYSRLVNGVSHP